MWENTRLKPKYIYFSDSQQLYLLHRNYEPKRNLIKNLLSLNYQ